MFELGGTTHLANVKYWVDVAMQSALGMNAMVGTLNSSLLACAFAR